jgi:hypothetical protein
MFCLLALQSDMSLQSRYPFILVLIDGDGYLFQENYLKDPKSGGGDAAHRLLSEVKDRVKAARLQSMSFDYQVVVNVYANKRGLTGALLDAGIISHPNDLEDFFFKFTQTQTLFQFIDCGPGKERVDTKIRGIYRVQISIHLCLLTTTPETYHFFLQNSQCKLIFLALCHDNGYLAELERYRNDATAKQKTWLIDHYAKARAFTAPPFYMVKLDQVFSDRGLHIKRVNGSTSASHKSSSYSSALSSLPITEPTSSILNDSDAFGPPPPTKPRSASDARPPPASLHEPRPNLIKEQLTAQLAPGVSPPTSSDQIPVVRKIPFHKP